MIDVVAPTTNVRAIVVEVGDTIGRTAVEQRTDDVFRRARLPIPGDPDHVNAGVAHSAVPVLEDVRVAHADVTPAHQDAQAPQDVTPALRGAGVHPDIDVRLVPKDAVPAPTTHPVAPPVSKKARPATRPLRDSTRSKLKTTRSALGIVPS